MKLPLPKIDPIALIQVLGFLMLFAGIWISIGLGLALAWSGAVLLVWTSAAEIGAEKLNKKGA